MEDMDMVTAIIILIIFIRILATIPTAMDIQVMDIMEDMGGMWDTSQIILAIDYWIVCN